MAEDYVCHAARPRLRIKPQAYARERRLQDFLSEMEVVAKVVSYVHGKSALWVKERTYVAESSEQAQERIICRSTADQQVDAKGAGRCLRGGGWLTDQPGGRSVFGQGRAVVKRLESRGSAPERKAQRWAGLITVCSALKIA
jgi:hypothetical protein